MKSSSENPERLENIVNYIETHIKDDISLEDLSKVAILSKYHLDHIFKLLTDESLMDYVRSRKLTNSIELLFNSDLSILDIALEFNFKHEQSYIRSFKKLFHISPGQLRKEKIEMPIVSKIDVGFIKAIGNGALFKPRFTIKPCFFVVGLKCIVRYADNFKNLTASKAGLEFFFEYKKQIKNSLDPDVYIGLVKCIPYKKGEDYYIPCTEVSKLCNVPSGMVGYMIKAHEYAVFKYIGFHHAEGITIKTLNEIYEFIFSKWLPYTSYSWTGTFYFERIDYKLSRSNYCEVDIYIPITE